MLYRIGYDTYDEKLKFAGLLTEFGYRGEDFPKSVSRSLKGTRLLGFDTEIGELHYYGITAAAAMCSAGIRFYTVDEFEFLLRSKFQELRQVMICIPSPQRPFPVEWPRTVRLSEKEPVRLQLDPDDGRLWSFIPRIFNHSPNRIDVPEDIPEMNRVIRKNPYTLLLDLHSFEEKPMASDGLPDICLGTDVQVTPETFAEAAETIFRSAGFTVERNFPFPGTLSPDAVTSGEVGISTICLSVLVKRSAYLDRDGNVMEEAREKMMEALKKVVLASHATERRME